jgi:carbonic anhydrase
MSISKLFFVCPDCHMESKISGYFEAKSYFATSLGAIVNSDYEFWGNLNDIISKKDISEIVIINDFNCTFIKETIEGKSSYTTKAFHELIDLKIDNMELINIESNSSKRQGILAELNIMAQLENMSNVAPISNKDLLISGYLYDRNKDEFKLVSRSSL